MKTMKLTKNNSMKIIEEAVAVLEQGGLIIFPTETCYGAGVKATDQSAVDKLLKYKKRPSGKAISIAVSNLEMAERFVELNESAMKIYKKFLPGPVTVVSKSKGKTAHGLVSEFDTLGIRIPDYGFLIQLVSNLDNPITSTSANSAGKKTPYKVEDILQNLSPKQKDLIDLIIDAGELPKNPPSTVIDTTRDAMQVLRQGDFKLDKEESFLISNEDEMQLEGEKIVEIYSLEIKEKGLLIMLDAELGAGKTQFVKGVARKLGINEIVKSPTYSILEEYDYNGGKLLHMDTWRLTNISEFEQLGIDRYLKPGNVIAVEWSGGVE